MKADNKTKTLNIDSNAELMFKKGDYIHTYVVIETSGLPNGATLYLLDENLNQLYSPYDINANQVKTPCTIIVGETDALQLPANYIEDEYTDFGAGTYQWKLKYHDVTEETFEDKIIPVTIKIIDFELEENLTPEIYPNEDVQIQLKTWVNTNPQTNDVDTDRLTTNAVYDNTTGIITYPNIDVNDLTIGQHTQTINQNYELVYIIKNPFLITGSSPSIYSNSGTYSFVLSPYQKTSSTTSSPSMKINGNQVSSFSSGIGQQPDIYGYGRGVTLQKDRFPPGIYNIEMNGQYNNNLYYSAFKTFIVETTDCKLSLSIDDFDINITSKYIYNETTPIKSAKLGLINTINNSSIETKTTDSNGECSWNISQTGTYKISALDFDDTILVDSPTILSSIIDNTNNNFIYNNEYVNISNLNEYWTFSGVTTTTGTDGIIRLPNTEFAYFEDNPIVILSFKVAKLESDNTGQFGFCLYNDNFSTMYNTLYYRYKQWANSQTVTLQIDDVVTYQVKDNIITIFVNDTSVFTTNVNSTILSSGKFMITPYVYGQNYVSNMKDIKYMIIK